MTTVVDTAGGNQPIIATNVSVANFTIGFDGNSSADTNLTVTTGGNLTTTGNNSYLGLSSNAIGALIVNGPNASVSITKNLFVGWNGTGNLTVSNGGNLTDTTFGYLGTNVGSNASANITGPGSIWTTNADLNVGYFGNGTLTVGNGATFLLGSANTSTRITVAALGNSSGAIILNNGTLTAANATLSQVLVNSRGSLSGNGLITANTTVAGAFTPSNLLVFSQNLAFTANATLNFVLTGPNRGIDYSAINVGGSIVLGGKLNLTVADGFAPYAGEVFSLLSSPNAFISNFAKITVPAIPNGIGLDTTNLTVNGNITAITVISNQTTSPVIVTQFQNTHFFVTAVGPDPRYDWQYSINGGASWSDLAADKHFSNVKSPIVDLTNATLDMSGHLYRCLVSTDITSAISNNITLIVNPLFDITTQPATQSVVAGSQVTFNFAVTSPGTLSFQWYLNGRPIKDGSKNGTTISGSQSPTLTIIGATKSNNGTYSVVATSALNGQTAGSNLAKLTVVTNPPRLLSQPPANLSTRTGRTASFRAYANGDQTLNFQWQISANGGTSFSNLVNGPGPGPSTISGATASGINTSVLIITSVSPLNSNLYRLQVTNAAGIAISKNATLTVN